MNHLSKANKNSPKRGACSGKNRIELIILSSSDEFTSCDVSQRNKIKITASIYFHPHSKRSSQAMLRYLVSTERVAVRLLTSIAHLVPRTVLASRSAKCSEGVKPIETSRATDSCDQRRAIFLLVAFEKKKAA